MGSIPRIALWRSNLSSKRSFREILNGSMHERVATVGLYQFSFAFLSTYAELRGLTVLTHSGRAVAQASADANDCPFTTPRASRQTKSSSGAQLQPLRI